MSIFFSGSEARLGSLGIEPMLPCPPLPNIVAEWAAILPLVCHLASPRDDYITTGDVALLGRLSIGLFPRLGTLSGIARLLQRGTKYLDYASSKGGSSRTVWDAKWGSVFPCANGAAIAAISKSLRRHDRSPPQRMPETLTGKLPWKDSEKSAARDSFTTRHASRWTRDEQRSTGAEDRQTEEQLIRRYQILHVYQLHRKQTRGSSQESLWRRIKQLSQSTPSLVIWSTLLVALAGFLCLFGCYGTAAIVICSVISELLAQGIAIRRPSGYLRNNENHDAYMLVASHENATEWHLYIGDRAIIDTLLNKPMFVVPEGRFTHIIANWFRWAHVLQLTAMTFVAAQKGWDGVCLVVLLAVHWFFCWSLRGRTLAEDWLKRESVEANVKSFEFGGRTAIMGAIQVFSRSTTTGWMDRILVPHPRREAWLRCLRGEKGGSNLDARDAKWLEFASEASLASAEVLTSVFGVGNASKQSA